MIKIEDRGFDGESKMMIIMVQKDKPLPREFCGPRFQICPSIGSPSDQCSSRAEKRDKDIDDCHDCDDDNHDERPLIRYLKVLDGLLPVASEAVDDTRGEPIHKPRIFIRILIFTWIVIFIRINI